MQKKILCFYKIAQCKSVQQFVSEKILCKRLFEMNAKNLIKNLTQNIIKKIFKKYYKKNIFNNINII